MQKNGIYQFPFDTSHNHDLQQKMTEFQSNRDLPLSVQAKNIMDNFKHAADRQSIGMIRIMVNGSGKMIGQLNNTEARCTRMRKALFQQISAYNFFQPDTSDFPFLFVTWSQVTQASYGLTSLITQCRYMNQRFTPHIWPNPKLDIPPIIHTQFDLWQKLTPTKNIAVQKYQQALNQTSKCLHLSIAFKQQIWVQRTLFLSHRHLNGIRQSKTQIQRANLTIAILYQRLLVIKELIKQNNRKIQQEMIDQSQKVIQSHKTMVSGYLTTAAKIASFGVSTQPLAISMATNDHYQYIYVCQSILNILRWAVEQKPASEANLKYKRFVLQCMLFCIQSIHFYIKGRFVSQSVVKETVRKIHVHINPTQLTQEGLVDSIFDTKYIPTAGFKEGHFEVSQLVQSILAFIIRIAIVTDTYQSNVLYPQYLTLYKIIQYTNSRMMEIMTIESMRQIWSITGVTQKNPFRQLIRMSCYFGFLYLQKLNQDFSYFSDKIFKEIPGASDLEAKKRDISMQYKMSYTSIQWFIKNIQTICTAYTKLSTNEKVGSIKLINPSEQLLKYKDKFGQKTQDDNIRKKVQAIVTYEGNQLKGKYLTDVAQSTALYRKFLYQIDISQKTLAKKQQTQRERILQLDRYAMRIGQFDVTKDKYVGVIAKFVQSTQQGLTKLTLDMKNDSFAIGCIDFLSRLNKDKRLFQSMQLFQPNISAQAFHNVSTPQLFSWIVQKKNQSKFFSQTGIDRRILTQKKQIDYIKVIEPEQIQKNFFIQRTNQLFTLKDSVPSLVQLMKKNGVYNDFVRLILDVQQDKQISKKELLNIFSKRIFPKLSVKTDITVLQVQLQRLKNLVHMQNHDINISQLGQVINRQDQSQFHVELFEQFQPSFKGKFQLINQNLLQEKFQLQKQILQLKTKISMMTMQNGKQIRDLSQQLQGKISLMAANQIALMQFQDNVQKQKLVKFRQQEMQVIGKQIAKQNPGLFTKDNQVYMTKFLTLLMQQYPQQRTRGLKQFFSFLGRTDNQSQIQKYLDEAQKAILNRKTTNIVATRQQVQQASDLARIVIQIFQQHGIQQKFEYLMNKQDILERTIQYQKKKIEYYKQKRLNYQYMASTSLLVTYQKNLRFIKQEKKKLFQLISQFFSSFKMEGNVFNQFKQSIKLNNNIVMKSALDQFQQHSDFQHHQFQKPSVTPLDTLVKFKQWANNFQSLTEVTQDEMYVLSEELLDQKIKIVKKLQQNGQSPTQANIISKMLQQIRYKLSQTQKQISDVRGLKELIACFYKDMTDRKDANIKLMTAVSKTLEQISKTVVPLLNNTETQSYFHKFISQVQILKKRSFSRAYAFTKCFIPAKHTKLKDILVRLQQFFPTGYTRLGAIKAELSKKQSLIQKILEQIQ